MTTAHPPRRFRESGSRDALAIDPDALAFLFEQQTDPEVVIAGGAAIVCIDGPLDHKAGWFFDSYECIAERFEAAIESEEVDRVILKIDSPGGEVAGLFETCRAMKEAAKAAGKRVIAYADEAAYSAGYALACVADEIYMPESAGVGSVGCIMTLLDATAADAQDGLAFSVISSGKYKADGNPHVKLSDDVVSRSQARVDSLAEMFFENVSAARGMSPQAVKGLEAACLYGSDAVKAGLVDGIASLAEVIEASAETETVDATKQANAKKGEEKMRVKGAKASATAEKIKKMRANALAASGVKTADAKYEEEKKDEEEKKAKGEDDTADEEKDDSSGALPSDDSSGDVASKDDDSSGKLPESEDEEDDMDEDGKKKAGVTPSDVLAAVASITGKLSAAAQLGALHALADNAKALGASQATTARSKRETHAARVSSLVTSAIHTGKIAPADKDYWTKTGLKSIQSLTSYLDARKSFVQTSDENPLPSRMPAIQGRTTQGITEEMVKTAEIMNMPVEELLKMKSMAGKDSKNGTIISLNTFKGFKP